jgi:shikimate kinase
MPVISMFYGVIVMMYYFDNRQHQLPHIHVKYAEEEAVVEIPGGEVIEGTLRSSKMKLVQAWIEIHREELMANWDLAIAAKRSLKSSR